MHIQSFKTVFTCSLLLFAGLAQGASTSTAPYAGQQQRAIKALSPDEVSGLLNGAGMGMAKAAELNHFPGPKHVLELADALQLSAAQRGQTQALFDAMKREAMQLGRQIVDKERELDQAFAAGTITASALTERVAKIGELRGRLRGVHLSTHLQQRALLSAAQLAHYDSLRGYGDGSQGHGEHRHGKH